MEVEDLNPFWMCWVDSNDDVIIITKTSCITCLERKLNLKVVKKWSIK